MTLPENELNDFAALVRQLLAKYVSMQKELRDLKNQISNRSKEQKEMEVLANAAMHDYDMIKTAKLFELADGDLVAARKRLNKLIRDVNRCITLLTEQNSQNS